MSWCCCCGVGPLHRVKDLISVGLSWLKEGSVKNLEIFTDGKINEALGSPASPMPSLYLSVFFSQDGEGSITHTHTHKET